MPRYAYAERLAVGVDDTAGDLERAYQLLTAHPMLLAPSLNSLLGPVLEADVNAISPIELQRKRRRVFLSYSQQDGLPAAECVRRAIETPGGEFETVDVRSVLVGGPRPPRRFNRPTSSSRS